MATPLNVISNVLVAFIPSEAIVLLEVAHPTFEIDEPSPTVIDPLLTTDEPVIDVPEIAPADVNESTDKSLKFVVPPKPIMLVLGSTRPNSPAIRATPKSNF